MPQFTVSKPGQRLDKFLAEQLPTLSRASIAKLIEQGKVRIDGEIPKASYTIRLKDHITVEHDENSVRAIPQIKLPILYEDDDCMVIDKPAGVLTHSKGAFNPEATVATFITPKLHGLDGERGGIVHRLDRITSGVIICAKTPDALSWLQKQFSQRKTKKTYRAVVEGRLTPQKAIIDMPIERNPKQPQTFRVGAHGKPAQTAYTVIATNGTFSLVELKPITGRTHQLRVHLRHLGHPIVGDTLYGARSAVRVYLHAQNLEITLPNRQRHVFTSPMPSEFSKLVA